MNAYSIYDLATGKILRSVSVPEKMLKHQYNSKTQGVLLGETDDSKYFVQAGKLVRIPEQPSRDFQFNWKTKEWEDPRSLEDLKYLKWLEIKEARNAAEFAAFTYKRMKFDNDPTSWRRLSDYISAAKSAISLGEPFSVEFTLANDKVVTLSSTDLVNIEFARIRNVMKVFSHALKLRKQIQEAKSEKELSEVFWNAPN